MEQNKFRAFSFDQQAYFGEKETLACVSCKQDRQCRCNITQGRVGATNVAMQNQ